MATAQRWSQGALAVLVALAAVSCDGRGSEDSTPSTAVANVRELAPASAQVVEVTSFDGDRVTIDVDATSGRPPAPPLASYRELCGDLRPEDFGLDHPRLRVRWRNGGDDAGSVVFGDRNFSGGGVYARREGSPCINLVTVQTVRDIARMAGPGAAAPFEAADRATPDVMKTDSGDQIHPWVAQARRHEGGH